MSTCTCGTRIQAFVTKPQKLDLCSSLQRCKSLNLNHQPAHEPNYYHNPFHPVSKKHLINSWNKRALEFSNQ